MNPLAFGNLHCYRESLCYIENELWRLLIERINTCSQIVWLLQESIFSYFSILTSPQNLFEATTMNEVSDDLFEEKDLKMTNTLHQRKKLRIVRTSVTQVWKTPLCSLPRVFVANQSVRETLFFSDHNPPKLPNLTRQNVNYLNFWQISFAHMSLCSQQSQCKLWQGASLPTFVSFAGN